MRVLPIRFSETDGSPVAEADALEIDGTVFVDEKLPVGEFAEVTVTGHKDYDLIAR